MFVTLLAEHHLEFLSLKERCRGSSESTFVKCHIVGNLMHWLNYYFSPCRVYLTHYGISGAPEQSVCGILFLFYSQFLDNGDQVHSDQVLF